MTSNKIWESLIDFAKDVQGLTKQGWEINHAYGEDFYKDTKFRIPDHMVLVKGYEEVNIYSLEEFEDFLKKIG